MSGTKILGAYFDIPVVQEQGFTMSPEWQRLFIDLFSDLVSFPTSNGYVVRVGAGNSEARAITAASSKIAITNGNGVAGNTTIDVTQANVDHNSLLNYVANQHIDWTSTTNNFSTSGTMAGGVTTITSLNITADSNQIILDSDGTTTTLTDSSTANRVITLPDATDTLVGKATTDTFTNKTFDANGTGNSLSNVDVADLANGTDGELITWDAAGVADTVAVGTSGQVLTSNGVGAAPTFQAASSGTAATQAEMETATSTTVFVSPGRAQYHPGAGKGWARYDHAAATLDGSYNVSSVTDVGLGQATINWDTNFSSANYSVVATARHHSGVSFGGEVTFNTDPAAGSTALLIRDEANNYFDTSSLCVMAMGDQ